MTEATLDDRSRLTLPNHLRDRFGHRYWIVVLPGCIKLAPLSGALSALREEDADVEASTRVLREDARDSAFVEAGR